MIIRLTDHAKMRCEQRKISVKWLEARLNTVPFEPSKYNHERLLQGTNIFVVYFDGSKYRTVITLYLTTEARDAPKINVWEHIQNPNVKDMVHKAFKKSKKRSKRDKGKKRW